MTVDVATMSSSFNHLIARRVHDTPSPLDRDSRVLTLISKVRFPYN